MQDKNKLGEASLKLLKLKKQRLDLEKKLKQLQQNEAQNKLKIQEIQKFLTELK